MTMPVTYIEINSADMTTTREFFSDAFGWDFQGFGSDDYLVAPHGSAPGIDTGLLPSRDGVNRVVPVVRITSMTDAVANVQSAGGTLVVEPFTIPGVGRGAYITDPTGLIIGLHEYDADA